jgi:hypothetical protein
MTAGMAILALGLSGLGFYRSDICTQQQLDVTVTEVSDATNTLTGPRSDACVGVHTTVL